MYRPASHVCNMEHAVRLSKLGFVRHPSWPAVLCWGPAGGKPGPVCTAAAAAALYRLFFSPS